MTPQDYERMADAILRGNAVRLDATPRDVQDAAEIAIERLRAALKEADDRLAAIYELAGKSAMPEGLMRPDPTPRLPEIEINDELGL